MPPTLAAYAIPRSKGTASDLSPDFSRTARATGSIISVVAVLEIHMLSTAEAAMKPNTRRRLLDPPKKLTMVSAKRLCAPLLAIAVDSINPPRSNNISGAP